MPQVEVAPHVGGHALVRLGLDEERDVALPVAAASRYSSEALIRTKAWNQGSVGNSGIAQAPWKIAITPTMLNAMCAAMFATRFARRS